MEYYVYVYMDPRKSGEFCYGKLKFEYEPFYVGKGKGDRCNDHLKRKSSNPFKDRKIEKIRLNGLEPIVVKIFENIDDLTSQKLEIDVISTIGRYDRNLGPLTNMTDGGDGASGIIQSQETKDKRIESLMKSTFHQTVKSNEFRQKMRISQRNFWTEERRQQISEKHTGEGNPMFGKRRKDESIAKHKETLRQKKENGLFVVSEETRRKLSESGKLRRGMKYENTRKDAVKYVVVTPTGERHEISGAGMLQNFCKDRKIQYHTLKNNVGQIIDNTMITGNKIFAKNTIGWQLTKD